MEIIKRFDKENLGEMREAINKALSSVTSDYNVELKIGNISYQESGFTTKLSVNLVVDGEVQTKEKRDFENLAELSGCKFPLGYKFNNCGTDFIVTGFSSRSRKYPVLAKNLDDNKTYKYKIDWINQKFDLGELQKSQ